jgi:hypothetical protein
MTRFQYAMIMFTLVLILGKISPESEKAVWELVGGAWFVVMIINLVTQLIQHGKESKNDNQEN